MRHDHKRHMGSPCRSVFAFIVISMFLIKKVSKIWSMHLCLTSGRLVQVRIDEKSLLVITIKFYH